MAERPAPPPVSLHAALSSLPKEEPAETREVTREEFLEVEVEEHKVDVGAEQTEMNKEEQVIVFSSFFLIQSSDVCPPRQAPEAFSTLQNSLAEEEAAAEAGRASKGGSADDRDPALPGGGGVGDVKAKVADCGRIARSRSRESSPLKLAMSDTGERNEKARRICLQTILVHFFLLSPNRRRRRRGRRSRILRSRPLETGRADRRGSGGRGCVCRRRRRRQ